MSSFRFLHAADLHLDSPARARGEVFRRRIIEALRESFRRLVALALAEQVDALLLAGDVFDDERLSFGTEALLTAEIGRLAQAGIATILVTGNHDPGGAGLRAHAIAWPREHFHLIDRAEPRLVLVRREGRVVGQVHGIGHEQDGETRDLLALLPPPAPGLPSVALAHAMIAGASAAERHAAYAPSTRRVLQALRHDYVALGHVHRRQEVENAPPAHYPGNLQGRDFGECGEKGALLVELPGEGRAPVVRFCPLAPIRFEAVDVSALAEVETLDALITAGVAAFAPIREGAVPGVEWMLRLRFAGPCRAAALIRAQAEELAEVLASRLGALEVDLDLRALRGSDDSRARCAASPLFSELVRLIEEVRSDDRQLLTLSEDALAFDDRDPEARRRRLKDVLATAESEIADRLIEGGR